MNPAIVRPHDDLEESARVEEAQSARIAEALLEAVYTPGSTGATVAQDGSQPTVGYVVAVPTSPELRCADSTASIVSEYVRLPSVRRLLAENPAHHVGAWVDDDNRLCLDVVEIFAERLPALTAAYARGEQAIYCLHEQREYKVADGDESDCPNWHGCGAAHRTWQDCP